MQILSMFEVSASLSCSGKTNKLSMLYNFKLPRYSSRMSAMAPKISTSYKDYSANYDVARSNWLVTKLSREGNISEAREVFDKMAVRDVVTWATLISGYIKCGLIGQAKRLFDRADAIKDVVTWTAMVRGYVKLNRILEAERLFEAMPVKNVISWNTMIDGFVRKGYINKAVEMFDRMPNRNVVSWNTVITGLAQHGRVDEARELFDRMPKRDVISWTAMVTGLASCGRVDEARVFFERMPERNVVSWNTMISGYAKNMRLTEACQIFERMPERDLASWNTMLAGFVQNGDLSRARKLFGEMPEKNVVSWTAMVSGHVQNGETERALAIFVEMARDSRVKPNEGTFVNVLAACSDLAGLCEGQQVHQMISKSVYTEMTFVVTALINMYSKCGELGTAKKIFEDGKMSRRDLVSWNVMIAAYAHHGLGREAIRLFEQMRVYGFKPNEVSYLGLLSACSHAGLVEEGLKYFHELVRDGSIQVREDHFSCMVDLCSRAGRLREAYEFILQLETGPSSSSSSIWWALLAGCNIHGDLEIGKLAAEELLKEDLGNGNAGAYFLLSNIYGSSGEWRDAVRVRMEIKDKGLKKQPGCSWIQVDNRVHVFLAGDKSHSQSNHLFVLLRDLHAEMKKAGHVLNNGSTVEDMSCHIHKTS